MATVLNEKSEILSHHLEGEMEEKHLVRVSELGFGNVGVVLKVKHKPTGIIMARKVSTSGSTGCFRSLVSPGCFRSRVSTGCYIHDLKQPVLTHNLKQPEQHVTYII